MSIYQREILVRFGHCDPAGIVFYPRYFEMINNVVEDWFEDGLDISFAGLHYHRHLTTPTVHFDVDFRSPSRFGDRLTFKLAVARIGTSSLDLDIEASLQGEVRMSVKQTLVFIDTEQRKPAPIPDDLRKRIARFQSAEPPSVVA